MTKKSPPKWAFQHARLADVQGKNRITCSQQQARQVPQVQER